MNKIVKITGGVLLLVILGYLLWKFSFLIVYTLIAAVVSFLGHPIVRFLESIRYKKIIIPRPLSAIIALLTLLAAFLSLFALFVPLINSQIQTMSGIDLGSLTARLEGPLKWFEEKAHLYGVIPDNTSVREILTGHIRSFLNYSSISNVFSNIVGVAGSFFVALFSILFVAFFFIKDEELFAKGVLMFVPDEKHTSTRNVMRQSKTLLTRYFGGVILELLGVMTCITLGLTLFGVKNALLLGFFGGLMNIVPYIGPVIGTGIGIILGTTAALAAGETHLFLLLIKITGVFVVSNFIDNWILQPYIFSNSVKAHPLEIFYVIIIGGSLWGVPGMIIAVPIYTVLRIIAREFLSEFSLVRKLTVTLDEFQNSDDSS